MYACSILTKKHQQNQYGACLPLLRIIFQDGFTLFTSLIKLRLKQLNNYYKQLKINFTDLIENNLTRYDLY